MPAEPVPPDGVNWDAYTHEELYGMLREHADVAEVAAIAEEWRRHSVELADQAARLRDKQTALLDHWQGESAEQAASRLGELADRIDGISVRAAANQEAAQQASDALAQARALMPPPTGAGALPFTQPAPFELPSAPTLPSSGSGWFLTFGAPAVAPSGTGMGTAFGSVATSSASMYFGDFAANQAKAQAVQTMRGYESSLRGGESLVATPGTVGGQAYGVARSSTVPTPRGAAAPAGGGVPWERLVGGGQQPPEPSRNPVRGSGRFAAITPTAIGGVIGAPEPPASARAASQSPGMAPPPAGQRAAADEDTTHENRMPVVDHGLFTVDIPTVAPVIGASTPGGDL